MSPDATVQRRSGLPRTRGGGPWPPGGLSGGEPCLDKSASIATAAAVAPVEPIAADPLGPRVPVMPDSALRRGLPRTVGGDPWPPAGETSPEPRFVPDAASASGTPSAAAISEPGVAGPASAVVSPAVSGGLLRRGLPRAADGEAWPPAEQAPASAAGSSAPLESVSDTPLEIASVTPAPVPPTPATPAPVIPAPVVEVESARETAAAAADPVGTAPTSPVRKPRMIGSRPLAQWVKFAVWGLVGAVVVAGIIVLAARGVTTLPGVPEFMARFPGEYHPPIAADEGFPAWARWTHFLNFFFMVLIVRTGLLVRYQQKPPAFYTPKRGGKKISLYLWLHTSIDILWLLNGAVFVVLLFVTDHWVRIVPTSWEVFPNALSAGLQYLTLEWPTENGWVNYNSLQQLMYFTVVFIAAPLAAVTGVRMSEWWPERARRLNRLYPAPLARAIHFPVMLFFVLFVIVHVFLVLATGALRNLNHMFAGTDQVNWAGFWWFVVALLASTAVGWLARPLVIAPIANLFGRVSNR
ncbi:MAG: cytochrome b/b6 domain-containing protein [Candidatus Leucobacter sulfamidivorax]|nr:cytochrome b/b6 domain-containing protein [Candidatus Leucobacter sulfamidivorax]